MLKVVCFGEIMLRLSPPGYERIVQAKSFDIIFGGAEANVAVSLANFGLDASYVTKLPDNPVGDSCRNELRKYGVDVSQIVRGGERIGVFFCEKGASSRPSNVIYDRAGSAIAEAAAGDFDWDRIFDGAGWFHFTGITPALSDGMAAITEQACMAAKAKGMTVSCDLNYRKKLWSLEKAKHVMVGLLKYIDVLVNAADIFPEEMGGVDSVQSLENAYRRLAPMLSERYGIKQSAYTLREGISASDNGLAGLLYDGKCFYKSRHYDMHIVDRVGGGDAFTAGLIHGMLGKTAPQEIIEFATAASALKHTVEGDFNMVGAAEVKALTVEDSSGRVQR